MGHLFFNFAHLYSHPVAFPEQEITETSPQWNEDSQNKTERGFNASIMKTNKKKKHFGYTNSLIVLGELMK